MDVLTQSAINRSVMMQPLQVINSTFFSLKSKKQPVVTIFSICSCIEFELLHLVVGRH